MQLFPVAAPANDPLVETALARFKQLVGDYDLTEATAFRMIATELIVAAECEFRRFEDIRTDFDDVERDVMAIYNIRR